MATRRPVKKSSRSAFMSAMRSSKLELLLLLVIIVLIVVLLVMSCGKKDNNKENIPNPTGSEASKAPTEKVKPTEVVSADTPTPTPSPSPTPSPYPYGLCESVTLDTDAEPIERDNWPIDYLMLVNWTHRLKYSGNPENLVRLNEVLTADWYKIEEPYTVAEGSRNFVIQTEEDRYDRGNRVALTYLNEMCTAYHKATGYGVKVSQTGAYRNYATQDRFWNRRDKSIDPPRVVPGNASEHRTGLGFDIWVLDNEKYDYKWFRENCYKYGFILRYPSDKTKITGVTYEQWHFRYVGEEAATEMYKLNMCLEEYIEYLNAQAGNTEGTSDSDGSEKKPSATPTPTATPVPSTAPAPTDPPAPTATPVPTDIPAPTATPVPTPTPVPATPTPTPQQINEDDFGDNGSGSQGY